jgi:AAA15 family ATPase/GTPase
MQTRLSKIIIENIKNVEYGEIEFPMTSKDRYNCADIIGIYGQNGSGKTAAVDALCILYDLLNSKSLRCSESVIRIGAENAKLTFFFRAFEDTSVWEFSYCVILKTKGKNSKEKANQSDSTKDTPSNILVYSETISSRQIKKFARKDFRLLFSFVNNENMSFSIEPKKIVDSIKEIDLKSKAYDSENIRQSMFFRLAFNVYQATNGPSSFLFENDTISILSSVIDKEIKLAFDRIFAYRENISIVTNLDSSIACSNILLPLTYTSQKITGHIGIDLSEPEKMSKEEYEIAQGTFKQINIVLGSIIPGLSVQIEKLEKVVLDDGTDGLSIEILSNRDGLSFPFRCESSGIIKIVSILSWLLKMYNDSCSLVVIDELDSGIYEFLLGQILSTLNDYGKGQLIFTSHNLRALEVLNSHSILFTTANPRNRYIRMSGLRKTNNVRSVYIRAIQLGGQEEDLAIETDDYIIRRAFDTAGETQDDKKN